jgi:hypothetical protein
MAAPQAAVPSNKAGTEGGGGADGGGVEPAHKAQPVREVALHQPREQHVAKGDGGTACCRSQQERREVACTRHQPAKVRGPEQQPGREYRHRAQQHAFRAKTAGQHRGQRREDTQKRHGHGGEDNHRPARQAGVGRDLREYRRETGKNRAQVQADKHQAQAQVNEGAAAGPTGREHGWSWCGKVVDFGVDEKSGYVNVVSTGHGTHSVRRRPEPGDDACPPVCRRGFFVRLVPAEAPRSPVVRTKTPLFWKG